LNVVLNVVLSMQANFSSDVLMDSYAVLGNPIAHSKSPFIHRLFAQASGQAMQYSALEVPLNGFENAVNAFVLEGGRGVNVTLPFKMQAFAMASDALPSAKMAGAANALKFEDGRIFAENFDGAGLVNDIVRNLGFSLKNKRVLLLGAGGATRGALLPLAAQEPRVLAVVNRTAAKAHALQAEFAPYCALQAGGFGDLQGESFDVVLNATSSGLSQAELPLPDGVFAPGALAYELVYGKGLTPFLRQARAAGVEKVADGVGMLVEQAALAFAWWRGIYPQTQDAISKLTVKLI
jgi:shikimate dehydrogenase